MPRDPSQNARPGVDAEQLEPESIIEGELLTEAELEMTSHMNRSDLEPLLDVFRAAKAEADAKAAAAAAAEIEDTQEIPDELLSSLKQAIRVPQPVSRPPVAPAVAAKSATLRRSEFEAAMARLSPGLQNRVKVAMAMVQVHVCNAPDDFAADYLRSEVALHVSRGSLEKLLAEMTEAPYPAKITTAYSAKSGRLS